MDYQRLYDRLAPFYAPVMRLVPVWLGYAQRALEWLPPTGVILEIGPGPGVLLAQIAARYPQAIGFDLSMGMLRQAQYRLRRAGLPARLVRGDSVRLPYAAHCFDGIVLTFVLSAIPDGCAAMHEMFRVLRPGGVLALVDAGIPSDGNRIGRGLARVWALFGDFMRDEATLMRAVGLRIVQRREFGAFNGIRLVVGQKPD